MCARVGNQQSHGIVTARVRTDTIRSLRYQRQDLHQSTYPVPLRRSRLILLSVILNVTACHLDLFNKVGSKYHLLSRLNPVEWSAASTTV
jgi:hypothetical protein